MPKTLPVIDMTAPICCAPAAPMTDDGALEVALWLKALADPVRVRLMSLLASDEVCKRKPESNSEVDANNHGVGEC